MVDAKKQADSSLRPVCNCKSRQIELRQGGVTEKKMLIYDVRSRNVYENIRNTGIMPDEKSDIYVDTTSILQKSADFDGQFCPNSAFAMCLKRRLAATAGAVVSGHGLVASGKKQGAKLEYRNLKIEIGNSKLENRQSQIANRQSKIVNRQFAAPCPVSHAPCPPFRVPSPVLYFPLTEMPISLRTSWLPY
jgi:hypothetical protein